MNASRFLFLSTHCSFVSVTEIQLGPCSLQIGDGSSSTTIGKTSPTPVAQLNEVVAVTAGNVSSCSNEWLKQRELLRCKYHGHCCYYAWFLPLNTEFTVCDADYLLFFSVIHHL
jgi:hypothetical protein